MRWAYLLAVASACSFSVSPLSVEAPPDGGGDAAAGDALIDTPVDVPDGPPSAFGDVDLMPAQEEYAAGGDWTIDNVTIDTGALSPTAALPANVTLTAGVQSSGAAVAILRLRDFTVSNTRIMRVVGTRPLVIIAEHDIRIDGTIDLGALAATAGAGGFGPALGMGAGGHGVHADPNDDGGGGGGGFGTAGAAGGLGGPGGTGGIAGAAYSAARLVGGSGGGGPPQGITCTNVGGAGGGAILVFAKHKLDVKGAITAGGGGGSAGILCPSPSMYASGAGGGAGGMIYLQSAQITGDGALAANGGGGGGGACATGVPTAGGDGGIARGQGGIGSQCGGAGGNGGSQGNAPGTSPAAMYNGGGGGGAVGRIVYRAPNLASITSSPTAVTP